MLKPSGEDCADEWKGWRVRTKLAAFSDKLIESCWLTAVVAIPILFSLYTNNRFGLNKVCLVRSLALVMSLAWVVRAVERWPAAGENATGTGLRRRIREFLDRPLALPASLTIGITLLSTVVSIWPHGSFWGSYDRRQGAYATLSYVAISLLVMDRLRDQVQKERLATATLLGSVPVCLYALGQHYDLVPGFLDADFGGRVTSSFVNPIFLAAYLIMVVPITLRQLLRSLRPRVAGRQSLLSVVVMTGTYGALLVIQLYVILLTQSRGPFLALLFSLFFFFILWAACAGRRIAGLIAIGVALILVSLLAAVNLSHTFSAGVRDVPYVGRLSTIAGAPTLEQRRLIWQGVIDLSSDDPLRLILGYGPESMELAFYGHYPAALVTFEGPSKMADRSHNAILDALVSTGLVGSVIYLFLYCSVFAYGFHVLGLIGDGEQRRVFAVLLGSGGIIGFLAAHLVGGLIYVGVGISAGLLAGLLVYVFLFLVGVKERRARGNRQQLFMIALISAVVAHFVEIQVGIPVTATRLTFWVFAGVLASAAAWSQGGGDDLCQSVPRSAESAMEDIEGGTTGEVNGAGASSFTGLPQPDTDHPLVSALLVGSLLITVAYGFVTHRSDLFGETFTVAFLLMVWLPAGLIILGKAAPTGLKEGDFLGWLDRLLAYIVPSLLSLFVFGVPHLLIVRRFPAVIQMPLVYYLFLFAVFTVTGRALIREDRLPDHFCRTDRWWLYPILLFTVVGLVITTNLNLVRADISFHLGRLNEQANRWDQSTEFYERAVDLAPRQDRYFQFLGHAYLKKAEPRTAHRPAWFRKAEEALRRAVEINPLNPDHQGNLGNLYHAWADVTRHPRNKAEKLMIALDHYQESVRLAPETHGRLLREAMLDAHLSLVDSYVRLGNINGAIREAKAALDLASAGQRERIESLIAQLETEGG